MPRNLLEIVPNTFWQSIFETYLGFWGCILAVNLQIYRETSLMQRVNNVSVVRKVDNAIHRINHYAVDSVVCFINAYQLDSDLSGG